MKSRFLALALAVFLLIAMSACNITLSSPPDNSGTETLAGSTTSPPPPLLSETPDTDVNSTDEPATPDSDESITGDGANVQPGSVTYDEKPLSPLFGGSINEVVNVMGTPAGDSGDNPPQRLDYDGIHFWFDDDCMVRIELFELSLLAVDGAALDRNRAGLRDVLGEPANDGWGEGYYGAESVYYIEYSLSDCSIYFEFDEDLDLLPYMVIISR